MKNFFTLVSILFCFALQAQEAQKASAQRFIEAVINTSEEDYLVLYPMLKISKIIPPEEGGMAKLSQVFSVLKNQLQNHDFVIYSSEEALDLISRETGNYRASDILTSEKGVVFYVYLPRYKRFLVRFPIVVNDKNEIIAINIDYCKDNTICLQYL